MRLWSNTILKNGTFKKKNLIQNGRLVVRPYAEPIVTGMLD